MLTEDRTAGSEPGTPSTVAESGQLSEIINRNRKCVPAMMMGENETEKRSTLGSGEYLKTTVRDGAGREGASTAEDQMYSTDCITRNKNSTSLEVEAIKEKTEVGTYRARNALNHCVYYIRHMGMKEVALLLLVIQTIVAVLSLRMSRTIFASKSGPYLITTAVCVSEVLKVIMSFYLLWKENKYDLSSTIAKVLADVTQKPMDFVKVSIPALLYTVQNNLLFVALNHISGAVYQTTYQLKILTTALLSLVILKKVISKDQWVTLFILTSGVALIQLPSGQKETRDNTQMAKDESGNGALSGSSFIGLAAVLAACVTSALAGVTLEKLFKDSKSSVWSRNMQLGFLCWIISFISVYTKDYKEITTNGFFYGYNFMTWIAILTQSVGGIIVAAVLKYADNIVKCFANAVAISLSCLLSYLVLNDYTPSFNFLLGTAIVIYASYAWAVNSQPTKFFRRVLRALRITVQKRTIESHKRSPAFPCQV